MGAEHCLMRDAGGSICVLSTGHGWEQEDLNYGIDQLMYFPKKAWVFWHLPMYAASASFLDIHLHMVW